LHGYQKSLRPFLSEATLFVMPFRMGGGMRIKSLTALAAGLPLVTSPLGVEVLSVTHNKDCLIAHYPFEFAHYIIEIINSASLQKKLRKNALLYINLKHHEGLNNQFLDRYSEIVKKSLLSPNL
jgi:glycosyltransferase involved in cell wall biosynthesis